MKHFIATAALVLVAGAAIAQTPAPAPKSSPAAKKATEYTCPITKEKFAKITPGLVSTVGNKSVYFCCAGCKPAFDKKAATEQTKLAAQYGVAATKPAPKAAKPAAKKPA